MSREDRREGGGEVGERGGGVGGGGEKGVSEVDLL